MIHTQDADFTLLCCDAMEGLRSLPDGSVHCVVTSPPYFALRDYGVTGQLGLEGSVEEYVASIVGVFSEVRRVLRADGTLWLNLGDAFDTKQLIGSPWRVAFALQADGWYLRSDIIWSKPNPMPESVTDRPTKSHEYLFLLSKSPRYYWDQEAIREPASWARWGDQTTPKHANSDNGAWMQPRSKAELEAKAEQGRNVRSVWDIATQPYPEAHFATYPEELVRRCVLAGTSERGCCPECGKPWERKVMREVMVVREGPKTAEKKLAQDARTACGGTVVSPPRTWTEGWRADCECVSGYVEQKGGLPLAVPYEAEPCTVLDPFLGSGTTAYVARKHGRRSIGIELNPAYAELAARRMQQQSLFSEVGT